MPQNTNRIAVQLDRENFAPLTPVPLKRRHRLLFQVALFWLGEAIETGVKLNVTLRDEVRARLKEFSATYFSDKVYDAVLDNAATNAFDATKSGHNNLYAHHARTQGDRLTFRL